MPPPSLLDQSAEDNSNAKKKKKKAAQRAPFVGDAVKAAFKRGVQRCRRLFKGPQGAFYQEIGISLKSGCGSG